MAFDDRIWIKTRRGQLRTRIAGTGRPVLLLHGFPLDHRMWDLVIPELANDFLCIAPDLRGFGQNVEESFSFTMRDLARDCWELVDQLQIRQPLSVCGLSMGGYIAMEFVEQNHERISHVILTNTRCNADDAAGQNVRRETASRALRDGVLVAVSPMLEKLFQKDAANRIPETVGLVKQMMFNTRASTIAWAQLAMASRRDFASVLPSWRMSVACMGGISDTICPPVTIEQMHKLIPHSQIYLDPDSGHLTPLESPSRFNEFVRNFFE